MRARARTAFIAAAFAASTAVPTTAIAVDPTGTERVTLSISNNRTLYACVVEFKLSSGVPDTRYEVVAFGTPYSSVTNSRGVLSSRLGNGLKSAWVGADETNVTVNLVNADFTRTQITPASLSVRNRCTL
ncbi:MAG: hypothetical protein RJB61_562 [Actinomycetota bacterium]|jgi:hypothetical protein